MAYDRKITLYRCTAPNNELHKKKWLSEGTAINGVIYKDSCSILEPHIIIKTPDRYLRFNYLYSNDYQRYYFIEDIITLPQGQIELVCKVDVLYTYEDAIGNLVVHEERATNGQSNYIKDERVAVMCNPKIKNVYELQFKPALDSNDVIGGFVGQNADNIVYIVKYFTTKYAYISDDKQGDKNAIYNPPRTTSVIELGKAIANYAEHIYNLCLEYCKDKRDNDRSNTHILNKGIFYSQYPGTDVGNPAWFDKNYSVKNLVSRFDTMDINEKYITYNGNQVSTGLSYVPEKNKGSYTELNDIVWFGADCSQFAWRCCLFGSANQPIDIGVSAKSLTGTGKTVTTAGIAVSLLNRRFTYTDPQGATQTKDCTVAVTKGSDVVAGDIIISGELDSEESTHYIYKRADVWYTASSKSDIPNDASYWMGCTHARIAIGNNEYIDITTPYTSDNGKGYPLWSSDLPIAMNKTTLSSIVNGLDCIKEDDTNWTSYMCKLGSKKAIVFRPAYLINET